MRHKKKGLRGTSMVTAFIYLLVTLFSFYPSQTVEAKWWFSGPSSKVESKSKSSYSSYRSSYSPKKSSFSSFFSFGSSKKSSSSKASAKSSSSKKSSGGILSKIKSGVKKSYNNTVKKVQSVKRSITSKAKKVWNSATKKVKSKAKGIGSKITKAASKARSAVNRAKSKVKTVVKKVSSRAKSAVKRGASHIAAKARSIKNSAAKTVKSVTKKVKSFAKNVKNQVNHVIAKSKKTISKAVQKVKTATKRYATYVRSSLQKGYQKAKQSVKSAINLVKKGPKAAVKALGNKMKQAWNHAKKHASSSWNTVKNTAKKVINHPAAARFTKGALGVLQMVGGTLQMVGGVALSTTGLGALLGVPMAAHGAADIIQGFASTINAIAGKQVIPEVNFMQEAYKAVGGWIGGAKGEAIANYVFYIADLGLGFINAGKLAAQLKHVKDLSKLEQLKYLKVQYITQPFQTLKGKAVNVTKYGYNVVNKMSSGYNKAAIVAKNGFNNMLKGTKSAVGKEKTFAKSITSKGKAVYKTAKANLIAAKEAVGAGFNHIGNKMVTRVAMGVDPTLVIDGVKEGVKKYKEVKKVASKVTKGVSKAEIRDRVLKNIEESKIAREASNYQEFDKIATRIYAENNNWVDKAGNIIWPPNRGFNGEAVIETLKPGTRIDRYGFEGGTFVAPEGIPYSSRALAPGTEKKPYNIYEVIKPIEVQAGKIAPWFGEPGGGMQYELSASVKKLIEDRFLRRVK